MLVPAPVIVTLPIIVVTEMSFAEHIWEHCIGVGTGGAEGALAPPILGNMYIKYAEFILDTHPFGPPNLVYVPTLLWAQLNTMIYG